MSKRKRQIMVLLSLCIFCMALSGKAAAWDTGDPGNDATYTSEFLTSLLGLLDIVRLKIAPLIASLSCAAIGFQVMASSTGMSPLFQARGLEGAKQALFGVFSSYAILLLLPDIIVWVCGLFKPYAWTP